MAMRSAAVRDQGLRPRQLRALGYAHPAHDLYVAEWVEQSDALVRLAVATELATDGVTIGGWAAARVHEDRLCAADDFVRVFDGRTAFDEPSGIAPLLVLAPPESRIVARAGQRVFRSRVPDEDREAYATAHITSPLRTAFDLARLSSPGGAVTALDRLLSLGLVHAEDLRRMLSERPRWRGLMRARRALALADENVRSPMETLMRLEWLAAGLPRPRCNVVVEDLDGRFVAMVDLLDERTGLVGEYDGAHHAPAEQRRSDAVRRERMVGA
ncbi:MAG TPA: hypothetical protein VGC04_14575 [Cellulomonas sp.]